MILPNSKNVSFPVLLHQLLHGHSGKAAAFRGQRMIYSAHLVQLTESLAYLAERQASANAEATSFEKLSVKKWLMFWEGPKKSYLKVRALRFEECSQCHPTAAVTSVAVLGSIRFSDHFGRWGKWLFSDCTDTISITSAMILDSCYKYQHCFIPERGPSSRSFMLS